MKLHLNEPYNVKIVSFWTSVKNELIQEYQLYSSLPYKLGGELKPLLVSDDAEGTIAMCLGRKSDNEHYCGKFAMKWLRDNPYKSNVLMKMNRLRNYY